MTQQAKQGIPSSAERPDLYDGFDGIDRPVGWVNPIKRSPRIERMIAEKKASAASASAPSVPAPKQQPKSKSRPEPARKRARTLQAM